MTGFELVVLDEGLTEEAIRELMAFEAAEAGRLEDIPDSVSGVREVAVSEEDSAADENSGAEEAGKGAELLLGSVLHPAAAKRIAAAKPDIMATAAATEMIFAFNERADNLAINGFFMLDTSIFCIKLTVVIINHKQGLVKCFYIAKKSQRKPPFAKQMKAAATTENSIKLVQQFINPKAAYWTTSFFSFFFR